MYHDSVNYKKCFEKSGLKVGDKVKVIYKASGHEFDAGSGWLNRMDKFVDDGNIYTILAISHRGNVRIRDGFLGFWFPFFCLEKVMEE